MEKNEVKYSYLEDRLSLIEKRVNQILVRISEIGLQLEALNKTFICLYRSGSLKQCSVKIGREDIYI